MYKQCVEQHIRMDMDEYLDEKYEMLCGCNCAVCNPYYGDFWESFILQDERIYKKEVFDPRQERKGDVL